MLCGVIQLFVNLSKSLNSYILQMTFFVPLLQMAIKSLTHEEIANTEKKLDMPLGMPICLFNDIT